MRFVERLWIAAANLLIVWLAGKRIVAVNLRASAVLIQPQQKNSFLRNCVLGQFTAHEVATSTAVICEGGRQP